MTSCVEEDCVAKDARASKETGLRARLHAHFWVASDLRDLDAGIW